MYLFIFIPYIEQQTEYERNKAGIIYMAIIYNYVYTRPWLVGTSIQAAM